MAIYFNFQYSVFYENTNLVDKSRVGRWTHGLHSSPWVHFNLKKKTSRKITKPLVISGGHGEFILVSASTNHATYAQLIVSNKDDTRCFISNKGRTAGQNYIYNDKKIR